MIFVMLPRHVTTLAVTAGPSDVAASPFDFLFRLRSLHPRCRRQPNATAVDELVVHKMGHPHVRLEAFHDGLEV